MERQTSFDLASLSYLPSSPGVYFMKNKTGEVIYIGKAKNLKKRISQYFSSSKDSRFTLPYLINETKLVETICLDNEKEALILENNLIKKFSPKYNILLKDDKSFYNLAINISSTWPRLTTLRAKFLKQIDKKQYLIFGPYPEANLAKRLLSLISSLFFLRQCSDKDLASRRRPCILYELKQCLAPCVNLCSKEEYNSYVERALQFLKNQNNDLIKEIEASLKELSRRLEFEKAARLHKTLLLLKKNHDIQKIENLKTKNADVLGVYQQNYSSTITILTVRDSKIVSIFQYFFEFTLEKNDDLITSFLFQYYKDKDSLPKEILIPIEKPKFLSELLKIKLVQPKKGEKFCLIQKAEKNAKNFFEQKVLKRNKQDDFLIELQKQFHLKNYPLKIECFDSSHLSGNHCVGACIVLENGVFKNSLYKFFSIENNTSNDLLLLKEILLRRFSEENPADFPNLIIIDGGETHLNTAKSFLKEMQIDYIDIISISKESGCHSKGIKNEKIHYSENKKITLNYYNKVFLFVQKIRDEAHRKAINYQRKKQNLNSLKTEIKIPRIGIKKTQILLKEFGSWENVFSVSKKKLKNKTKLSQKDIDSILEYKNHMKFSS